MEENRQSSDKLPQVRRSVGLGLAPRFSLVKPPSINSILTFPKPNVEHPHPPRSSVKQGSVSLPLKPQLKRPLEVKKPLKKSQRKKLFKLLMYLYIYDKPAYEEMSLRILTDIKQRALMEFDFDEEIRTNQRQSKVSFAPQNQIIDAGQHIASSHRRATVKTGEFDTMPTDNTDKSSLAEDNGPVEVARARRQSSYLPRISNPNFHTTIQNFRVCPTPQQSLKDPSAVIYQNEHADFNQLQKLSTQSLNHIVELPKIKTIGNIGINEQDISQLRRMDMVSESLFNYFVLYLGEKQKSMDLVRLQKLGLRTLVFSTELMEPFRNSMQRYDHYQFDYDVVRHHTTRFHANGKTIFDFFDLILVPFIENKEEFKLVVVDLNHYKMHIYDSLKLYNAREHKENSLNGLFKLVVKFVESEHYERSKITFGGSWQFHEHEAPRIQNLNTSGLYACFYAYHVMKGNYYPRDDWDVLSEFKEKILGLLN